MSLRFLTAWLTRETVGKIACARCYDELNNSMGAFVFKLICGYRVLSPGQTAPHNDADLKSRSSILNSAMFAASFNKPPKLLLSY